MKSTVNNLSIRKLAARGAGRAPRKAGLQQCLIVASDPVRQSMLVDAACDAGWETLIAPDAAAALVLLSREFIGLAVVDLEGRQATEFTSLFERLRRTGALLSLVCGNEGNVQEEIYVRQTNPWLYLPGVQLGAELSTLLQQGRQLSERMQPSLGLVAKPRNLRRSG